MSITTWPSCSRAPSSTAGRKSKDVPSSDSVLGWVELECDEQSGLRKPTFPQNVGWTEIGEAEPPGYGVYPEKRLLSLRKESAAAEVSVIGPVLASPSFMAGKQATLLGTSSGASSTVAGRVRLAARGLAGDGAWRALGKVLPRSSSSPLTQAIPLDSNPRARPAPLFKGALGNSELESGTGC